LARPTVSPFGAIKSAVEPVVPWSIARITSTSSRAGRRDAGRHGYVPSDLERWLRLRLGFSRFGVDGAGLNIRRGTFRGIRRGVRQGICRGIRRAIQLRGAAVGLLGLLALAALAECELARPLGLGLRVPCCDSASPAGG
jgi:hypothetical protein